MTMCEVIVKEYPMKFPYGFIDQFAEHTGASCNSNAACLTKVWAGAASRVKLLINLLAMMKFMRRYRKRI